MKYLMIPLALILLAGCGSNPRPGAPGAVISVGSRSVLDSDVAGAFEEYRGDSTAVTVLRDNILARELFLAHAEELDVYNDIEVQRQLHERRREILQNAWIAHELDKVESDDQAVRDFWQSLGTGVRYTALALRDSLLMDSVATMVRAGEHLSVFAAELGLEDITRSTAGRIEIPDRNYANLMDLDHLSDLTEGDIIGPFTVPVGYRILQIDSVWTYEPAPFQEDSARIASMLLGRAREERKKFAEDSLRTSHGVSVNPEAIEMLVSRATQDARSYEPFTEDEEAVTAVTWDGGSRNVYSMYRNAMNLPSYLPRNTLSYEWTQNYAEQLALYDIEMQEAEELGLDTLEVNATRLRRKEMETVLDYYYDLVIEPRIQVDSVLMNQVYNEIREDHPVPESRVFNVLLLSDPSRISTAEEMLEAGEDILGAADRFEIFPPILEEGESYRTVPLQGPMIPEGIREILFALTPGEETIVSLNESSALWFSLLSIDPEHIPELGEIRDRVFSVATQRMETQVIEGLVDSLEAAYHPYVNEDFFLEYLIPLETSGVSEPENAEELTDAL